MPIGGRLNNRHLIVLTFLLSTSVVSAEAVRIDVRERSEVAEGRSYGLAGAYERISGRIHFAVDPESRVNRMVRDIGYAPTNEAGLVEFSADFHLLKPKQIEAGNGAVLFDVPNRGHRVALRRLHRAAGSSEKDSEPEIGDAFLLRRGFSVLWVGWQLDVAPKGDLLRFRPPIATDSGRPIEGLVRSDFFVSEKVLSNSLGDRGHVAYPVVAPRDPRSVLTVRRGPMGERQIIPREKWQFARYEDGHAVPDPTMVYLETGFEPGRIYEVVYVAQAPPVAGLGLAAIRDSVSGLKDGAMDALGIPSGAIDRAIAFGSSQSGRLLRTFLYDGFNEDERGNKVLDGVIPHIAGGARGSFNHRFAQPSRSPGASFEYANRIFPFADGMQVDPATGARDGLLLSLGSYFMPKVFYTNSSAEYWRSVSALTHTTVDGTADLRLPGDVRTYHFAGTQHGPAPFPPRGGAALANPNDYGWFLRALVVAMDAWIRDDTPPPPSRVASLEEGTLVEAEEFSFPPLPGVRAPAELGRAYALDHGPQFRSKGVITLEPPKVGGAYPFLVPRVDEDGNEVGGLRSPEISVPLATYTGWVPSNPLSGAGLYIPFARTRAEREANGDPRLSAEERYKSREEYLGLVAQAAMDLIDGGYLLDEDLSGVLSRARAQWDYIMSRPE